jgi:hypothetical protein
MERVVVGPLYTLIVLPFLWSERRLSRRIRETCRFDCLLAGPLGPDYRPGIRMRPEVSQKWSR